MYEAMCNLPVRQPGQSRNNELHRVKYCTKLCNLHY